MKRLLMVGILLIVSRAHSQTFTDNTDIAAMLDKAKQEYLDNGIDQREFKLLDSVVTKSMPYPNVGYWQIRSGIHTIYLHPYALRNKLALEYTLLHELGHMHGILDHDEDDSDSMMFNFHQPPENEAEWTEMKRKYYDKLRLIRRDRVATVE